MTTRLTIPRVTASVYPADILVILIAVSLPWSTSLPAVFVGLWLVALVPIIDLNAARQLSRHPACILPVAFFGLALVGTIWFSGAWSTRLYYVGPLAKLLAIPLLIYQFQRSRWGTWVFVAFLVSCAFLMIMSWIVAVDPRLALRADAAYGVPVKNYIDQSQEFVLCAIALAYPILQFLRQKRFMAAGFVAVVAASFLANMVFVTVSRTALVTLPFLLGLFAFVYLPRRSTIVVLGALCVTAIALWFISPNLREHSTSLLSQYRSYTSSNAASSVGLRLEFWKKSMQFFCEAPLIGHGTGSVRSLFTQSAIGQTGAAAEVIANPHNQTLYVAIQWGVLGVSILCAMWISHLLLFRGGGLAHWIGLLVVVQNMMSSLFNSHLFDFHEGWMYVLGVGVAGGMVLPKRPTALTHNYPPESSS